eukprot:scaffold97765_cov19-Tisochrysis_lutea.AAC.2
MHACCSPAHQSSQSNVLVRQAAGARKAQNVRSASDQSDLWDLGLDKRLNLQKAAAKQAQTSKRRLLVLQLTRLTARASMMPESERCRHLI